MEHQPSQQELSDALTCAVLASQDVKEFLNGVAALAGRELSLSGETAHCAVTLIRPSGPDVIASSTETAQQADELQYALGDGPCLTAATTGKVVEVTDFHTDQRWPSYFREAAAHGVGAVLAVPIPLPGQTKCAINLYATEGHAFSDLEILTVQRFAAQASAAVQLAVRIADMQTRTEDLMTAMTSRTVIDIAVGIIMGQSRCSQEAAFDVLRAASSHRNQKLRDVAAEVVKSVDSAPVKTHFTH